MTTARLAVLVLSLAAIGVALWHLERGSRGLTVVETAIGGTPVILRHPVAGMSGPAVVIAHGFAGSRQLMAPFAVTLARNGYTTLTFDFLGHGRNPAPLVGDVTTEAGATAALVAELGRIVDHAAGLPGVDGRIALLGHSMASDIVVRQAVNDPRVAATVAVSLFSRAVTDRAPRNLLIVVGAWERFLGQAALDTVSRSIEGLAEEARTYEIGPGNLRRAVFADNAEHVAVLYSRESMAEALDWVDLVFNREGAGAGYLELRGPWIVLLLGGIVALAWPLAGLLPRLAMPQAGAGLGWRGVLVATGGPALATPLLLWQAPTDFLPVLVADYLAVHFALYGLLCMAALWALGALPRGIGSRPGGTLLAALALGMIGVGAIGAALDAYVASFLPQAGRVPLTLALLAGTLPYLLAEEWATRGAGSPRWAYAAAKLAMFLSLALAVALNLEDLFFLIIILPVVVLFFLLYGLFSGWAVRATGQPAVAGLANAVAFAWALGVTFPLLDG